MSFEITWTENALQNLEDLEILLRKRIFKKIEEFAKTGNFHGVKRVQGYENTYRLRIGNYRAIFEINNITISILKIGHRKNIY